MSSSDEPAFPVAGVAQDNQFNGMSLRDYFASRAPAYEAEWFSNYCRRKGFSSYAKTTADWSYEYADAMLEARK